MFYNIWAGLMVLSMILVFLTEPIWAAGFCLFYYALMWILETGKRKAEREKSSPLG